MVALGTTVTRALEHAASSGEPLRSGAGVATQRIGAHTALRVVDAIVTGVHESGESHYELLRAFASDAVLEHARAVLEQHGYRSHEFGDSVLLARQRPVTRRRVLTDATIQRALSDISRAATLRSRETTHRETRKVSVRTITTLL